MTTTSASINSIAQKELERTPGMVAVSGVCGRGVSGGKLPTPPQQIPGGLGDSVPHYLEVVDNVSFEATPRLENGLSNDASLYTIGDDEDSGQADCKCQGSSSDFEAPGQALSKAQAHTPGGDREGVGCLPAVAPDGQSVLPWEWGAQRPLLGFSHEEICNWLSATCDKGKGYFIEAHCEDGHSFAKELVCNKEWCSICGDDGSIAHNRRFARWLPKVMQIDSMGYFVFTIPQELREKYRTKKALGKLGHQVQELLKGFDYSRGLRRWHWFGDKSTRWHPHLNVIVDGHYINERKLDAIKRDYASLLGVLLADINYHYRRSPGKMVHTLKYVARASFRDYELDMEMALELRGFRNMVVWGRGQWDNEPAWSLADLKGKARAAVEGLDIPSIESLVAGVCPVCGKALTWGEALPIGLLANVEKRPLGAGYYRLADIRPPPELPAEVKLKLHWMELIHRAEVKVATERAEAEALAIASEQQGWWASLLNNGDSCRLN